MDTKDYIEVFLDESNEHLQAINDNLLKLEKQPADLDIVNEIFRSAHTLKGMAGTMEFEDIASLTHKMENVLDKIRNQELEVNEKVVDIIFEALEDLEEMVSAISSGEDGKKDVSELVTRLEQLENGTTESVQKESIVKETSELNMNLDQYQMTVLSQAEEQGYNTFQVTVILSEDCLLKAARVYMVFEVLEKLGEVIKSVPVVDELEAENFEQEFTVILLSNSTTDEIETHIHKVSEVQKVEALNFSVEDIDKPEDKSVNNNSREERDVSQENPKQTGKGASSKTIRVSSERIDYLMNLFEELVLDRGRLEDLANQINNVELDEAVEHISRVSKDMQDLILTMRMVPVDQVFNRFPRMVRGLAKDLNKRINLEIAGADTELDRTVIDEIGDPLVHLIRNSVDHGIESPEERKKAGKPEEGKLILRAFHSGNHVFIEIEDDGAGINRDKVVHKAIENGLITNEHAENLKDEDVYQLILSSGFSTAEQVSDISGRGVGLDAVRMKIQSLGGNISISSEPGKGSTFSIELPLTLSILSSLLVEVQDETYGIPLSSVIETVLLEEKEIMYSHRQKVMDFRGKVIPLLSLQEVFNVPDNNHLKEEQYESVVIINKGDRMTGLIVDSFIGKKEVVLKSLGNYLKNVYAISGATILGNGEVSLIIDPNALIK
ncbi:chemotaxis protein CheA [Virgibacillus doumboii]|uniref:chemotaxis protein CheA n=1 Tax=Virgibacillus doumboii TaxID=2697503 RepID=UPI0013DF79D0|nr:chemotaxis protein CheA [Virgibacillus doumboii]